eukprot:6072184-Amphidinium_carterae.1
MALRNPPAKETSTTQQRAGFAEDACCLVVWAHVKLTFAPSRPMLPCSSSKRQSSKIEPEQQARAALERSLFAPVCGHIHHQIRCENSF